MFAELNRDIAKGVIEDTIRKSNKIGGMDSVIILWDSTITRGLECTTAYFDNRFDAQKYADEKLEEKDGFGFMCCAIINGRVYEDHGIFS